MEDGIFWTSKGHYIDNRQFTYAVHHDEYGVTAFWLPPTLFMLTDQRGFKVLRPFWKILALVRPLNEHSLTYTTPSQCLTLNDTSTLWFLHKSLGVHPCPCRSPHCQHILHHIKSPIILFQQYMVSYMALWQGWTYHGIIAHLHIPLRIPMTPIQSSHTLTKFPPIGLTLGPWSPCVLLSHWSPCMLQSQIS